MLQERWLLWKVGLYNSELISLQRYNFWAGGIAYDSISLLGLSLQSPIEFIQKFYDGTYVNNI